MNGGYKTICRSGPLRVRQPPGPEDAPFRAADFNVFVHVTAWVGVQPKPTKQFEQIAKQAPELRDELERLCQKFRPEHISALAEALHASAKGAIRRGPRKRELPAEVVGRVKALLHQGMAPSEIARQIEPMMPGLSPQARLKRAHREVAQWVGHKSGFTVNYHLALQWWATLEARRQLDEEIRSSALSESEALERVSGRISEIMSRASGRTGQ